jgi:hypothetical protein
MIMTRKEAQEYRERWQLATARIIAEIRQTPPLVKLQQLSVLFETARVAGWSDQLRSGDDEVRERWRRLKARYV